MTPYNHINIEKKWQKKWEEDTINKTGEKSDKKFYILDMFPYPSGEGLHVGHPKGYIATDIYSRMKKMQGYDVLHPMGFDAFGLPAEQYALKNNVNPNISTAKNVARYKKQLQILGLNYDWEREINTTDPKFYKWTQWMWKQMYKKGLAYESYDPINWCPSCKTGLANEDLENGLCERCGSLVEKKPLRQWTIRITDYADRLLADLDKLDWEPHIKELQRNWVGKSEGSLLRFQLVTRNNAEQTQKDAEGIPESIEVFTTRADTIFGATFMAISYELAEKWLASGWVANPDILSMIEEIKKDAKQLDFSFKEIAEKIGIDTGIKAINPATGKEIPVYIANYILSGYGTGAIMAVPAHDERDYEFAKKYNVSIKDVIAQEKGVQQKDPEFGKSFVAVVYNQKTKTFLSLNWGPLGESLFVDGEIDEGESVVSLAVSKIKAVTGNTNLKLLSLTGPIYYNYFAHSENVARRIEATGLFFELVDELRGDTTLEANEKNKFTLEWLSENDVLAKIKNELHSHVFVKTVAKSELYIGDGILINSEEYDGLSSVEAKVKITEAVGGKLMSTYKLKDWTFARQRYWGEPFPIVFDENHTSYAVADTELPVVLPMVDKYEPTGTGESPLAAIKEWIEVYGYINAEEEFETLPKDDVKAKMFKRESNTMPQWAGSSWYYLRYIDPHNDTRFVDVAKEKKWSPVDFYVGGADHATRHLIYARFWHKFLFDLGLVSCDEPFIKLQTVGNIMAEDGRKMSKRWGNVVNPDDVVREYGADTLRIYEMFMGPFDQAVAWSTKNMSGSRRFLERVYKLAEKVDGNFVDTQAVTTELHKTIKKVGEDIEQFKFNTAISQMMILLNILEKETAISSSHFETFLKLLAPFVPHLSEEIWKNCGYLTSVHSEVWPTYNASQLVTGTVIMAVQIGGKMRGTIEIARDSEDSLVMEVLQSHEMYKKYVGEIEPKKVIIVKNKIVNVII